MRVGAADFRGVRARGVAESIDVSRDGARLAEAGFWVVVGTFEGAIRAWRFEGDAARIASGALAELIRRIDFLNDVGLGYLGLDRDAATLSGGEMQRLRLSAQLGAGLTGALYVLDEPTIGLHPSDTARLLRNLRALVNTGSTVVVVEHDAETIRAADHIIDLGPSGGRKGGRSVAQGPSEAVLHGQSLPLAMSVPLGVMALAVVVIGVWPSLLQGLTGPAGTALLKAFGG